MKGAVAVAAQQGDLVGEEVGVDDVQLLVAVVVDRTFKDLKLSPTAVLVFMFVLIGGAVISTLTHPAWMLVGIFSLYLVSGMLESVVLLSRHLKERRAAAALAATLDDDEDDDSEDDVDEQEVL